MFIHWLKVSLAHLLRNRLYSLVNIAGFGVGLAACMLIGMYVQHELAYDRYHPYHERIYRVSREFHPLGGPVMLLATNAPPVARLLLEDFPEIEAATRINRSFNLLVKYGEVSRYENRINFADSSVFEFFSFDWLQGDPETALAAPGTVVLTESMAQRYFGSTDPMGKVLELSYGLALEVTGVIRDLPDTTHLQTDALASLSTLNRPGADFEQSWGSNTFYTFVKLREGASADVLVAAFPDFLNRHYTQDASSFTAMRMQPLTDIHLHSSELQLPMKAVGNINSVLSFSIVALCILLIACFNFMNLSVARSTRRSRETGMRKAVGAGRSQLVLQFLGESVLAALLAMVLGLVLVELGLPVFNSLLDMELSLDLVARPLAFVLLLGTSVMAGLLAGAYPAFYLSAVRASRVLRGELTAGRGGLRLRNFLVVLQFSAAISLVVATVVVQLQLNFARTLDTGFSREQMLILNNLDPRWSTLKTELQKNPDILGITASNMVPGEDNANALMTRHEGGPESGRGMQFLLVDHDFFSTYDIDILAGRGFSPDYSSDQLTFPDFEHPHTSGGVILSAMAARQAGWTPQTALGKWFEFGFENDFSQSLRGPVLGVVADIHFESVATPIEPVAYLLPPRDVSDVLSLDTASLRLSGNNLTATLDYIDATWSRIYPEKPVTRSFLAENLAALYRGEDRLGNLFTWFAALAVVVACLGLFGLASFNAQRRTREIGVRKVMGGSVWSIVLLLTNDFSRLVLVSNVIAWPLAYVAMERWLENFAYRIDLTPVIFIGSGLIALCIAWVTVGGTAAKAASRKPVLALRYE